MVWVLEKVGENFRLINDDREIVFSSTQIVEIIDGNTFKTINFIGKMVIFIDDDNTEYKIEYI